MTPFEHAIADVFAHEGGYVNDPVDPGGETNFGISKRAYPHEDIRNLTRQRAAEIYRLDYWERLRCDELPPAVAGKLFNVAVNFGRKRAVCMLQEAACHMGSTLRVDGIMGDKTIAAAKEHDPARLVRVMCDRQQAQYVALIAKNPSLGRFASGWDRRANYAPTWG